jgi:hypothetical protein
MKFTIYIFLLVGINNLYSQSIDLKQLILWRESNYKVVDGQLLKLNWEKSTLKDATDIYRNDLYQQNKESKDEKSLTLIYTNDYKIENNTISYSTTKNEEYSNFLNQINSSGYKLFKSKKSGNVASDYFRSDNMTAIVSVLEGFEIKFFTIFISTNEDYYKSHKD